MAHKNIYLFLIHGVCCSAYAGGLLGIHNPANNADALTPFVELHAFEGRDHNQINDQWSRMLSNKSSNIAIVFARAEAGVQWQGWGLSTLQRGEALMYANRDTVNLAQQYTNTSGYDSNRTYNLDYRIRGFTASGLKLSKSLSLTMGAPWKLQTGVGLSVLRGSQIKQETITGQIVATSSTDFDGSAQQNISNSGINTNDPNVFNAPFGKQRPFSGEGYALDAGLILKHEPTGTLLEFAIADLAGAMDWFNVPNYDATLNTATKYFDANGYANFNPSASSISSYRNIRQTLDPKIRIAATYPLGRWQLQAAAEHTQGYNFMQTGVGYQLSENWLMQAEYDWHFSSIGVGVKHRHFELMLRSDSPQTDTAKALGLSATLKMPI